MPQLVTACVLLLASGVARAVGDAGAEYTGGFRMEGDAKIETVFGDAALYRRGIDKFFAVHADMQRTREAFSRSVQAVLASLAAHQRAGGRVRGGCPVDAVAPAYARALGAGQSYHALGKELEATHASIRELDSLGETGGLTPDYRWKVGKSLKLFPQALRDFKEMKATFQDQLAAELRFHGCDPQALVARGDELDASGTQPAEVPNSPVPPTRKAGRGPELAPPVPATTATFFVDNSTCEGTLRVYLDGAQLGDVGAGAKAAFRALVGRHDLCLIPASAQKQCGDPGTLRRTYIHDGWSIALRCD